MDVLQPIGNVMYLTYWYHPGAQPQTRQLTPPQGNLSGLIFLGGIKGGPEKKGEPRDHEVRKHLNTELSIQPGSLNCNLS